MEHIDCQSDLKPCFVMGSGGGGEDAPFIKHYATYKRNGSHMYAIALAYWWGGGALAPQIKLNHGLFSIPYKWFINIRDITWFSIKCVFLPFCCKLTHSQIAVCRLTWCSFKELPTLNIAKAPLPWEWHPTASHPLHARSFRSLVSTSAWVPRSY